MTVSELIEKLERMDDDAEVTVESEHQGDGIFTHSVYAGSELVATWDVDDNE